MNICQFKNIIRVKCIIPRKLTEIQVHRYLFMVEFFWGFFEQRQDLVQTTKQLFYLLFPLLWI